MTAIATSEVEDVRTVIDYYNQFDDPIEAFRENQRKLQVFNFNQIKPRMLSSIYWNSGTTRTDGSNESGKDDAPAVTSSEPFRIEILNTWIVIIFWQLFFFY